MHDYVQLAHQTLRVYLETGQIPAIAKPLPSDLGRPAAVFVTLTTADDQLRGCRGTIEPVEPNLAEAIVKTTIASAVDDPRFEPLTFDQLAGMKIKIDILGPLQPVTTETELDPRIYGVLVQSGGQRAVLLPDIPAIETVDQQLTAARRKANILPRETIRIFKFTVERYT
jgi:AmmeMemoRadiSam system protein A